MARVFNSLKNGFINYFKRLSIMARTKSLVGRKSMNSLPREQTLYSYWSKNARQRTLSGDELRICEMCVNYLSERKASASISDCMVIAHNIEQKLRKKISSSKV